MEMEEIKTRIKKIIFETTNIKPEAISDTAHFVKDLELDSLTMLEIGVNVDQEFEIDLPEEEMDKIIDVVSSVDLVMAYLAKKAPVS